MKTHYEYSDEYLAGWKARHEGVGSSSNPYHLSSRQFTAWNEGWQDCHAGRIDGQKALGTDIPPKDK